MTWDAVNRIATLTLNRSFEAGEMNIQILSSGVTDTAGNRLDGEWQNGITTYSPGSGNGVAGGDFMFNINVLPGDTNRSGDVSVADQSLIEATGTINSSIFASGNPSSGYNQFYDVNGDNRVDSNDVNAVRNRINGKLL